MENKEVTEPYAAFDRLYAEDPDFRAAVDNVSKPHEIPEPPKKPRRKRKEFALTSPKA